MLCNSRQKQTKPFKSKLEGTYSSLPSALSSQYSTKCESNTQLHDLNFAKPKQHLFSVKPCVGGNVLVNGPYYTKSRRVRLTLKSSHYSLCLSWAYTVLLRCLLSGNFQSHLRSQRSRVRVKYSQLFYSTQIYPGKTRTRADIFTEHLLCVWCHVRHFTYFI